MTCVEARRGRASLQLVVVALVSAVVLGAPDVAYGHAIVKETQPAIDEVVSGSPARVLMRFNEPVELSFGAIRVFDTNGNRVDAGEADHLPGDPDAIRVGLEPDLASGSYTVTWRVVSADGHPISEAFVFHVDEPGENPLGIADEVLGSAPGSGRVAGVLFGAVRWLNFGGLVLLAGAVSFLILVWTKSRASPGRPPSVEARFAVRFRRIVVGAWLALVLATLAGYVLQGSVAGDLPLSEALAADVLAEVAETRYGKVAIAKAGLLIAAALVWVMGGRRNLAASGGSTVGAASAGGRIPAATMIGALAVILALLVTPGLSGHAGTTDPVVLNLTADTVHLVAAGVWLGGLVLLVTAFRSVTELDSPGAAATMAPVVTRFSDVAVNAVVIIVATGVYRAWIEVGAFRALTAAPYGWVLIAKLAVFAPLLVLGAINNRVIKPRIERAMKQNDSAATPLGTLRKAVAGEIALGAIVLAVTALLVNLPPARIDAGIVGPFVEDVRLGSYNLNVIVDPNKVGENEIHLTAGGPQGTPAPIKEVRVLFRKPSDGIGPLVARGTELAPGHFVVQGRQLSVSGDWQIEIIARLSAFDEERTKLDITVN